MFKGLRTKIESEQKGQIDANSKQQVKGIGHRVGHRIRETQSQTYSDSSDLIVTKRNESPDKSPTVNHIGAPSRTLRDKLPKTDGSDQILLREAEPTNTSDQSTGLQNNDQEIVGPADGPAGQIASLRDQLKSVINERDASYHQHDKSYQLIEALEKDLEHHKITNTSLESKLAEYESMLQDQKTGSPDRTRLNGSSAIDGAFSKSFNPKGHFANASDTKISDNVEVLRYEIIELQAQLAKKNRQLKIRQQNLIDMKKALQKEILDHGRTRDELVKLQKQLKNHEAVRATNDLANYNHVAGESNMSDQSGDPLTLEHSVQQSSKETPSNKKQVDNGQGTASPQAGNIAEDTISLNAANMGTATVQLDRISYLSRSSASVDDLESNDLQHSNNNREVSHEYLRNVLFRYMTSTDTETTQHLVKAISVLMEFTPEQLAAIKSSMNGRTSSWLRLK